MKITILEAINLAISNNDIVFLKKLNSLIKKHHVLTQTNGQMSARLKLNDTPMSQKEFQELDIKLTNNSEEGFLLDMANAAAHALRLVEYNLSKVSRPNLPRVVAEGDSWWLHQLLPDVIDQLSKKYNIRSMAAAGDTVENMLSTDKYIDILQQENSKIFLFSGGGNDVLGDGKIGFIMKDYDRDVPISMLIKQDVFQPFLDRVLRFYEVMINQLGQTIPDVQIFSHGYDDLYRIDKGPWIWPFLKEKGYNREKAREVVKELLIPFNDELAKLSEENANFNYVDTRGSVAQRTNAWFDAIHPKKSGFSEVANKFSLAIDKVLSGEPCQNISGATNEVTSVDHQIRMVPRPLSAGTRSQDQNGFTEALIHSSSDSGLTDFETIRMSIAKMDMDQSRWRVFEDESVREHILEVIDIMTSNETEDPQRIKNRLETRPTVMTPNSADDLCQFEKLSIEDLNEALFGHSEIEPIRILSAGYKAAQAVGRVQVMSQFGSHIGHGTGFMVAPGLFLTNHHVLGTAETAEQSYVIFNDELSVDGSLPSPKRFRITSDIYVGSKENDYAFVSIANEDVFGNQLSQFGFLPLIALSGKALKHEPISIIQHPGGDPKSIAIRNSFVMGRRGNGIYYTTDTMAGSSGSCVFNREWQVVGLHHRYVPHPLDKDGVLANRGIRVSSIFDALKASATQGNQDARYVIDVLLQNTNIASYSESDRLESVGNSVSVGSFSNNLETSEITTGVYRGLNEDEFKAAIAMNDTDFSQDDIPLPEMFGMAEEAAFEALEALPTDRNSVLQRIGAIGYKFIIGHEVSSKAYYDIKLKNPILPGASSGITIGIGYDLGYQSVSGFRKDWEGLLSNNEMKQLENCIGLTKTSAANKLPSVKHISIPYSKAILVFERTSLPKFFGKLNKHIKDNVIDDLAPDCVAALVSLTFNRGASYQKSGDRYQEMREVRAALNGGIPQKVPQLIRDMKRLWVGKPKVKGLLRRRDEEADLFQQGLNASNEANSLFTEMIEHDPIPDNDEESSLIIPTFSTRESLTKLSWSDVNWVNTYSNNADYWHLPKSAQASEFELSPHLIEKVIASGRYTPHFTSQGHLIVAIRGAKIADGSDHVVQAKTIRLLEQKPNHKTYRCIICVYHRDEKLVSAFMASTVPNRGGVASCANLLNGVPGNYTLANLLPTGCYELCVGTHYGSVTVPTVLRLGTGEGPSTALRVTTLRTKNDGIYGTKDLWDNCKPADNIHPGFNASSADFSSLGCLTVPGSYSNGTHSGLWAKFRTTGGFDSTSYLGIRYNLLLTTGMEMSALSSSWEKGQRLAHGSEGDEVRELQKVLGLPDDGTFGPSTKEALTKFEKSKGGISLGIWSRKSEENYSVNIFTK